MAEQFISTNYRNMPVVRGSSLIGIVSRGDVIKIVQGIKEFKDMKASDIMTYDITAVQSKEPIRNALEMMRRIDARTIPVVDDNFKLAGIIGIRDIINYSWTGGRVPKETRGEKTGNKDPIEVRVRLDHAPVRDDDQAGNDRQRRRQADAEARTFPRCRS